MRVQAHSGGVAVASDSLRLAVKEESLQRQDLLHFGISPPGPKISLEESLPPAQVGTIKLLSKKHNSSFNKTLFFKNHMQVKTSLGMCRPDITKVTTCGETCAFTWGLCDQKGPVLGLMLCCRCLRILCIFILPWAPPIMCLILQPDFLVFQDRLLVWRLWLFTVVPPFFFWHWTVRDRHCLNSITQEHNPSHLFTELGFSLPFISPSQFCGLPWGSSLPWVTNTENGVCLREHGSSPQSLRVLITITIAENVPHKVVLEIHTHTHAPRRKGFITIG